MLTDIAAIVFPVESVFVSNSAESSVVTWTMAMSSSNPETIRSMIFDPHMQSRIRNTYAVTELATTLRCLLCLLHQQSSSRQFSGPSEL